MPSSTHHAIVRALLAVALTVAVVGLGLRRRGRGGTTAAPDIEASPPAADDGEAILIKTHVTIQIPYHPREFTGEVLDGSFGDSPFCSGARFRDRHGNADIGLVDRPFDCPDGSLRIGFTPGVPQGRTQTGPWKVLAVPAPSRG